MRRLECLAAALQAWRPEIIGAPARDRRRIAPRVRGWPDGVDGSGGVEGVCEAPRLRGADCRQERVVRAIAMAGGDDLGDVLRPGVGEHFADPCGEACLVSRVERGAGQRQAILLGGRTPPTALEVGRLTHGEQGGLPVSASARHNGRAPGRRLQAGSGGAAGLPTAHAGVHGAMEKAALRALNRPSGGNPTRLLSASGVLAWVT